MSGPRLLDENPTFANDAERVVWQALHDQLGPDDLLGANVRVTHEGHDREIDLLVGLAGGGVVTLEVKGGPVWLDQGDCWWQRRGGEEVRIDPVGQARNGKFALRAYVEGDPRWHRRRIRWSHAIVLPHTRVDARVRDPGLPAQASSDATTSTAWSSGLRLLVAEQTHHPPASARGPARPWPTSSPAGSHRRPTCSPRPVSARPRPST